MTVELIQGTDEWRQARVGLVTASRVSDIIAKGKSGPSASRMNYLAELACERLTGKPAESFHSKDMDRGNEIEPQARAAYAFMRDVDVTQVGLIMHPTISEAAASPDGLVGDDGLVEFKSPKMATHINTILTEKIPGEYLTQCQWQMSCSGRQWDDCVSFHPDMPPNLQLFVKRVPRDNTTIISLEVEVRSFLADLARMVDMLKAKGK